MAEAEMTECVKLGDDVTLYLGDCLEVLPTLAAGSVDFVFTDPPYGHNNNSNGDLISRWEAALGTGNYIPEVNDRPILNDGIEANEIYKATLPELYRILQAGCCCCCCCSGGGPDPQFARWSLWMDEIFNFKQMVVWDKGPMGMGWHYRRSYETILVGEKSGAACRWFDETHKVENIIRPGKHKKIIPLGNNHPTEKPVSLATHFISLHTKQGDFVIDPFMGSGTTGVACVQTGRKFIGIEIDPKYFEMAVKRIKEAQLQMRMPI